MGQDIDRHQDRGDQRVHHTAALEESQGLVEEAHRGQAKDHPKGQGPVDRDFLEIIAMQLPHTRLEPAAYSGPR